MKITTVRRISQLFFFALFVWFCIVATVGEKFWQIRNWPINWILQLDPLVALGTILSTGKFYWPLHCALGMVIVTIIFGRFFCGWVCPFGSIHHFVGYLGNRSKKVSDKIQLNKYRKAQSLKYLILVFLLAMAAFPSLASSLQTGLLDPIPLVTRSFNLVLLPVLDRGTNLTSVAARFYELGWLTLTVFAAAVLLNLVIPRFYCRFLCPLGAFFGIISRFSIWRIGKTKSECIDCKLCEKSCEGGCEPSGNIKIAECVLCFNCRDDCKHNLIAYQTVPSLAGETPADVSRRGFCLSLAGGVLAVPAVRLSGKLASNWESSLIRPPGALEEREFLKRCIKCGQCMRICPTNVIQPAGIEAGLEGLWTPTLNNRIGSSGCQLNCVACGQVCSTSAIRPITLDEKKGEGDFADKGPVKLGTAFIDRNRCLPWSLDKPCIVCQENCPVSPKAIYTRESFSTVRDGVALVKSITGSTILIDRRIIPGKFGTGDYYVLFENGARRKIAANADDSIGLSVSDEKTPLITGKIEIQVCLQRPYIDIEKCIGCGVCEHECPVSGLRAIRVSAEGETRSKNRRLLLR
ncbi:MAG: 4Fe-4S binding protein [Sedimentisphaerales bacterium]|nr:4Fe-4S binding protein [Sedimentisphaerales bacterium]